MNYHLAQLNIARFRLPPEHEANTDFIQNLDNVNALAESSPGFVWRMVGEGDNALDIQAFDDPNMVINMSVWQTPEALAAFVYRNKEHRAIMRRRAEWFDHIDTYLVLWWVPQGHEPSLSEAKEKLDLLSKRGPSEEAFTVKDQFPAPID